MCHASMSLHYMSVSLMGMSVCEVGKPLIAMSNALYWPL